MGGPDCREEHGILTPMVAVQSSAETAAVHEQIAREFRWPPVGERVPGILQRIP